MVDIQSKGANMRFATQWIYGLYDEDFVIIRAVLVRLKSLVEIRVNMVVFNRRCKSLCNSTTSGLFGLYDDTNNHWAIRHTLNGTTELFFGWHSKLQPLLAVLMSPEKANVLNLMFMPFVPRLLESR